MAENTVKTEGVKKTLTYDEKVIKKIAGIATDSVSGVLTLSGGLIGSITDMFRSGEDKTKGIDAEIGEKQVALDLNVVCEYGKRIPDLFDSIVEKVSASIKNMTGLEVVELNMHVQDVLSHAEFEELCNSKPKDNNTSKPEAPAETAPEKLPRVQ